MLFLVLDLFPLSLRVVSLANLIRAMSSSRHLLVNNASLTRRVWLC
jgi:hypothetical protein